MMSRTKDVLQEELQKMVGLEPQPLHNPSIAQKSPVVDQAVDVESDIDARSALQDLSLKVELCLKKQKRLRFITKEISEIIKKSS